MSATAAEAALIRSPRAAMEYLHQAKPKHDLGVLVLNLKGELMRDYAIQMQEDRFRFPFACACWGETVLVYRRLAEGESDRSRPTPDDLDAIERLRTISQKTGIALADYLIIGRPGGFDFSARGAQGWDREP